MVHPIWRSAVITATRGLSSHASQQARRFTTGLASLRPVIAHGTSHHVHVQEGRRCINCSRSSPSWGLTSCPCSCRPFSVPVSSTAAAHPSCGSWQHKRWILHASCFGQEEGPQEEKSRGGRTPTPSAAHHSEVLPEGRRDGERTCKEPGRQEQGIRCRNRKNMDFAERAGRRASQVAKKQAGFES